MSLFESDSFLNLCSLTDSVTEIVQLAAANLTVADNLYRSNVRRIYRENTLDAYAVSNTSDSESL